MKYCIFFFLVSYRVDGSSIRKRRLNVKGRKLYDIFSCFYIVVTAISLTVHGSLQLTTHEYPLKHSTKHINEEHFTDGRTLVTVIPLAEDSSNSEMVHFIEELHTSGSWAILVYSVSFTVNRNIYTPAR